MPKNRNRRNYYRHDEYNYWGDPDWKYGNRENYPPNYYENTTYGHNFNYKYQNWRQKPYDYYNQRKYHDNAHTGQKYSTGWRQKNAGYRRTYEHNRNSSSQNDSKKVLTSLNKTAEVVTTIKADNVKQCNLQSSTVDKEIIEMKPEAKQAQSSRPNFQFILEKQEQAYKTLKFQEQLNGQREENLYLAETKLSLYDEATVRGVRLFQTREELVQKTKQSRLYKKAQEVIKERGPCPKHPKTPEVALQSGKWKENYYKPWVMDMSRLYFQYLDDCDDAENSSVLDEECNH